MNIAIGSTQDTIREKFASFGEIESINLLNTRTDVSGKAFV